MRFQYSSSPLLGLDSTEPNSRSSTDSSDTVYTEYSNSRTPKPLDIIRSLEKQASQSLGLPGTCISYRKVKKAIHNLGEKQTEELCVEDLYETVPYINSKSFMKSLQNNVFLNGVASKLNLTLENIHESHIIQEKIHCKITEGDRSVPCEIIPSVKVKWPLEQTLEFSMKGDRSPEQRKRCIFPTPYMINEIISLDCVLLPKGYLHRKGERNDADIEWEFSFPQAQKYLETFMSHAQMKSLLILLALHKTYIEPKTKNLGLSTDHLRNFLLLECESNFSEWPEHRLGIKLISVLKHLNSYLSKARPNIPDFFVTDKNILSEIPTGKIRQAQKAIDEIIQAPVMYFMKTLRNLRYTKGKTFFPPMDFKKLYEILTKSGLELSNPQLAAKMVKKPQYIYPNPDMMVQYLEHAKKKEHIMRKRQEDQQKATNLTDERRGSVDSIDVSWDCEKVFDLHKKRELLKFFIKLFIDIAETSLRISSKNNTLLYIKQAYYLTKILQEQCAALADEAYVLLEKIVQLEKICEQKDGVQNENGSRLNKTIEFSENTQRLQKSSVSKNDKNERTGLPRKSVTFQVRP